MTQMAVVCPFDEPDLRDQRRLDPRHFGHLLRSHAASPMGSLAVREIDEWARRDFERLH